MFEHVLADVPKGMETRYRRLHAAHLYKTAGRLYEPSPRVVNLLWNWTRKVDVRFDIVTFLGDEMHDVIDDELNRMDVPFGSLWCETPESLAKRMAYSPNVLYLIHGDSEHQLTYGPRGFYVYGAQDLGTLL